MIVPFASSPSCEFCRACFNRRAPNASLLLVPVLRVTASAPSATLPALEELSACLSWGQSPLKCRFEELVYHHSTYIHVRIYTVEHKHVRIYTYILMIIIECPRPHILHIHMLVALRLLLSFRFRRSCPGHGWAVLPGLGGLCIGRGHRPGAATIVGS